MKKLTTLILLFISLNTFASHMIGGEITWKQSGGTYVFTLKVYVECSPGTTGFTTSPQAIDVTGHPAMTYINANFVSTTELSPINCGFSCAGNNTNGSTFEEYIYRSNPVNLGNFTPPASGWFFTWNFCCRNTLQNISGSTGFGLTLRSIMYEYNNTASNRLYNTSPEFMVKSPKIFCAGSNVVISQSTVESDGDSISYSFEKCADGNAPGLQLLNYSTPYTVNNPLPGIVSLDAVNGDINWQSSTSVVGNFGICVRVDEYRCGVKIASIFREDQYATTITCAPVQSGSFNSGPSFQINSVPSSLYLDTVNIGDTVSLNLSIYDYDINPNTLTPQNVQLLTYGEFGTNDTSTTGCNAPPCATLDVPGTNFFPATHSYQFNWVVDCNNFINDGFDASCNNGFKRTQFLLRAVDDYCPSSGYNDLYIALIIKVPYLQQSGDTLFCLNGSGTYQWYKDDVPLSGATNSWYVPIGTGSYNVITTSINGCSSTSNSTNVVINCSFTPTVTGNVYLCPQQGTTLSTQNYLSYQWYSRTGNGARLPIAGETSQSIIIPTGNVGKFFSVEVSDSACMEISPEVRLYNLPTMGIQFYNLIPTAFNFQFNLCIGDTAQLSIHSVYDTNIIWTNNGDTIIGANTNVLQITDSGHYTVSAAPSDCPQNIVTAPYTIIVGLDPCTSGSTEIQGFSNLSISPNPAKTSFSINFDSSTDEMMEVDIYSASGVQVMKEINYAKSGANRISIGGLNLKKGAYIVVVKSEKGLVRGKLVIR